MKRTLALVTGILSISIISHTSAQEVWSLEKCIEYAIENNIQIKRQEINNQYNSNQQNQAKSDRLPTLNVQLSNSLNFGRSLTYENTYANTNSTQYNGGLSTRFTIWNGSVLQNTIKQKELDLLAGIQDLQKAKDDITLNIAASYLEILFADELINVANSQIDVTKQQIERTSQLVEAGSLAKGALLEIEAQLAGEQLQLVNNQNQLQLSYLSLYQLLDLPIEKHFQIEKPELPQIKSHSTMSNSMDVFKNSVNNRPEIKAARLRVESAKKQLSVAKGSQYPSLVFSANYYNLFNNKYSDRFGNEISFSDQLRNNERYGLGLTLQIPIFNKFQVKNAISNARLQIIDNELQLQTTSNLLRKDIELAYTNALAALKRYFSSEKAVKSMEEAFRYIEEKYSVGMVNSVEYNQSKNNLTKAQSDLLQAKYEYIFRTKILDFYNGVPIEL